LSLTRFRLIVSASILALSFAGLSAATAGAVKIKLGDQMVDTDRESDTTLRMYATAWERDGRWEAREALQKVRQVINERLGDENVTIKVPHPISTRQFDDRSLGEWANFLRRELAKEPYSYRWASASEVQEALSQIEQVLANRAHRTRMREREQELQREQEEFRRSLFFGESEGDKKERRRNRGEGLLKKAAIRAQEARGTAGEAQAEEELRIARWAVFTLDEHAKFTSTSPLARSYFRRYAVDVTERYAYIVIKHLKNSTVAEEQRRDGKH
jgi:hypothetical protein